MPYFRFCRRCDNNFIPSSKYTFICPKCNRNGKCNRKKKKVSG